MTIRPYNKGGFLQKNIMITYIEHHTYLKGRDISTLQPDSLKRFVIPQKMMHSKVS